MLQSSPVIVTGSQIPNVLFDEEVGLRHKVGEDTSGWPCTRSGGGEGNAASPVPGRPRAGYVSWPVATRPRPNPEGQRTELRRAPAAPLPPHALPSLLAKPPLPQRAARGLARRSSARPSPAVGLCAVPAGCRSREPGRTHHLSPSGPHVLLLCQPVLILRVGCVLQ